jgi:hypothetical protein
MEPEGSLPHSQEPTTCRKESRWSVELDLDLASLSVYIITPESARFSNHGMIFAKQAAANSTDMTVILLDLPITFKLPVFSSSVSR